MGALWHQLLFHLGATRPIIDQIRLISIVAGALSAGLFRWRLAPRLADTQASANHATAWLVLGSTYSRLLVSDEFHMLQMPFLVAFAASVLDYLDRPSVRRAVWAGIACGLTAACFISDVLLGMMAAIVVGVWHYRRGERRAAAGVALGIGGGLTGTLGAALGLAWWLTKPAWGFLSWVATYAGGAVPERSSLAYGLRWTVSGAALAAARALYGAASSIVDLSPAVRGFRNGTPAGAGAVVLVWLIAAGVLGCGLWSAVRHRAATGASRALLLQWIFWPPILLFGLCWNNSDDQFYFQLAVPLAALAARIDRSAHGAFLCLLCSGLVLFANGVDVAHRFIFYPRAALQAALIRETEGACATVVPGYDDSAVLLALAGPERAGELISLTDLAVALPLEPGMRSLSMKLQSCLASGRRVEIIDVLDTTPQQPPWRFLRTIGYPRDAVMAMFRSLAVPGSTRHVGPFRLRSIRAGAPH